MALGVAVLGVGGVSRANHIPGLLLCPDCSAEHHTGDFDEGAGA